MNRYTVILEIHMPVQAESVQQAKQLAVEELNQNKNEFLESDIIEVRK
jgi:hypothetical protein